MYYYTQTKNKHYTAYIFEFTQEDTSIDLYIPKTYNTDRLSAIAANSSDNIVCKVNIDNLHPSLTQTHYTNECENNEIIHSVIMWNNGTISIETCDTNHMHTRIDDYVIGSRWVIRANNVLIDKGCITPVNELYKKRSYTLIGQTYKGNIILCVIEKRGILSKYCTLRDCVNIMRELDCKIAAEISSDNSELIYHNCIMNKLKCNSEPRTQQGFVITSSMTDPAILKMDPINAIVIKCNAKLFDEPNYSNSNIITNIPVFTKVKIIDIVNTGWYKIQFGEYKGYINEMYVKRIR